MNVDEIKSEIDLALDQLKDFGTFKHLFSKDDATKSLAKLRRTVQKLSYLVKTIDVKDVVHPTSKPLKDHLMEKTGPVRIKPCGPEYGGKTYFGVYVGDIAISSSVKIENDKISCEFAMHNPAIFVPALGKVIYGIESYWSPIESEEDMKEISDEEIGNIWYIKALKEMSKNQDQAS